MSQLENDVDPDKVRSAMAEREAEANRKMDIADAFREAADEHEREAWRIRAQFEKLRALLSSASESNGTEDRRHS